MFLIFDAAANRKGTRSFRLGRKGTPFITVLQGKKVSAYKEFSLSILFYIR